MSAHEHHSCAARGSAPAYAPGRWRRTRGRVGSVLAAAMVVVMAIAWAAFLRPQFVGGPAAFVTISGHSMEPRLRTGDLVLVERQRSYRAGDVIAYRIPAGDVGAGSIVIHRVVGGTARSGYVMRGDNRSTDDLWRPKPADVVGKMRVALPKSGRLLAIALSPLGLGTIAGLFAFVLVATRDRDDEQARATDDP